MAFSDFPNPKESVFVQRKPDNSFYEEINVSGSDLIVYHDSNGILNADKISVWASHYGLGGGGPSVSSSWASHSLSSSYAGTASVILGSIENAIFALSASWASKSLQSYYSTQSLYSTSSLEAVSASWASQSLYSVSSSWASQSLSSSFSSTASIAFNLPRASVRYIAGDNTYYIPEIDNIFYSGDIRFNNSSSGLAAFTPSSLYGLNYGATSARLSPNTSGSVFIDVTKDYGSNGINGGYIYVYFRTAFPPLSCSVSTKPTFNTMFPATLISTITTTSYTIFQYQTTFSPVTTVEIDFTASAANAIISAIEYQPIQWTGLIGTVNKTANEIFYKNLTFRDTNNTSSILISNSGNITLSGSVFGNVSGSLFGTASFANNANSASYATPHSASEIPMLALSNSTYTNVQQLQDIFHSAGWVGGGFVTTGSVSGSFLISAGDGLIRGINNSTASIYWFSWNSASFTASSAAANTEFFVYASYNNGNPIVVTSSVDPELFDYQTNVSLARMYYVSSSIREEFHINPTVKETVGDHAKLMILFNKAIMPYAREVGGILGGGSGDLSINISAGAFWEGLNRFTTNLFNSSGSDQFSNYYLSGSTWVEVEGQHYIDNLHYNNTSSGLVVLSTGSYAVNWIYLAVDSDVHAVYGQTQYATLSESQASTVPTLIPPELNTDSFLIGRVIVQSGSATLKEVDSVFFNPFVVSSAGGSTPTDHNSLTGLQGGTSGQYYHLTAAEYAGTGTGIFVRQNGPSITGATISGSITNATNAVSSSYAVNADTASNANNLYRASVGFSLTDNTYYIPEINNIFYNGQIRFTTTTGSNTTSINSSSLFGSNYVATSVTVPVSDSGSVNIDFTKDFGSNGLSTTAANLYLYFRNANPFLHIDLPLSVSVNAQATYLAWFNTTPLGVIVPNANYTIYEFALPSGIPLRQVQVNITSSGVFQSIMSVIECQPFAYSGQLDMFRKTVDETLYKNITIKNAFNTASVLITNAGNISISGSLFGNVTGSLFGTASQAISASWAPSSGGPSVSASYVPLGRSIVLCSAFTPVLTGPDFAEITVPYSPLDGTSSLSWNIKRLNVRTQAVGTTSSSFIIEKSTSTGLFSPITIGTVSLPIGTFENATTGSLGTTNSGDKLRFNVASLGNSVNNTVIVEISNA